MAEFRIHHDVNKLLNLLDVEENPNIGLTAEQLSEQLIRSVEHPVKTKGAIGTFLRKLDVQHNQELKTRYEQLKANNVHEVDPLVNLMARINEDGNVKHFLKWQNNLEMRRQDKLEAAAEHHSDPIPVSSSSHPPSSLPFSLASYNSPTMGQSNNHYSHPRSAAVTSAGNDNNHNNNGHSHHPHPNPHPHPRQRTHSHNTNLNINQNHHYSANSHTPSHSRSHTHLPNSHLPNNNHHFNGSGAGNGGIDSLTPTHSFDPARNGYGPPSSSNTGSNEHLDNLDGIRGGANGGGGGGGNGLGDQPVRYSNAHRSRKNAKDRQRKKESLQARMKNFKIENPFLSLDFHPIDWTHEAPVIPLGSLALLEQEASLICDLLFVLTGTDGQYIRMTALPENPRKFGLVIDQSGDKLLYTLASRIQRLCPIYSVIIHFVEDANNGLVNQALGGAMREILKDYLTLLAQLESQQRRGELTLQRMWFFLQPCFAQLEILKQIVDDISKGSCYGGATLSVLHQVTLNHSGDPKAQSFCMTITKHACEPYFEFLEKWIYQGIIDDIHGEFFIEDKEPARLLTEDGVENTDSYWESRFTVNELKVPKFLDPLKLMILKTGKYLSVIRKCGKPIEQDFELETLFYTTEERFYREKVESAYTYASQELLALLINDSDLLGRFDSIKHYFLLDQGDFMVQFMDIAEDELEKDINDIIPSRLESLLELALRTSVLNADPYKDDVHIELRDQALLAQLNVIIQIGSEPTSDSPNSSPFGDSLKGFESIVFNYNVQWPLSLIITRQNLACYQMLFRHLFYCKYIERLLSNVWKVNKVAKCYPLHAVAGYAQAFALRQKMLNFVQNVLYYMMVELIEPSFHVFIGKVKNEIHNVDEMIKKHTEFVDDCLKDSMLTEGDLLSSMIGILRLCTSFGQFMQLAHRQSTAFELQGASADLVRAYEFEVVPNETLDGTSFKMSFEDQVTKLHEEFNSRLLHLLQALAVQSQDSSSSSKLLHIMYRLDFNGFYTKFMDDNSATVVQI